LRTLSWDPLCYGDDLMTTIIRIPEGASIKDGIVYIEDVPLGVLNPLYEGMVELFNESVVTIGLNPEIS
jgi:hypothetical protein